MHIKCFYKKTVNIILKVVLFQYLCVVVVLQDFIE